MNTLEKYKKNINTSVFRKLLLRQYFLSPRFLIYIFSKKGKRTYTPALTRESEYKSIWQKHYESFISSYSEKFESKFGKIPSWKLAEVDKLLTCGKFNRGFVWNECHDCKIVLAVPFSCKSRLCLSCYRKKLFGWSIQLSRILNPELPHYHIVFTLPGRLNELLLQRLVNPRFLNKLAAKVYTKRLRTIAKVNKNCKPGILSTLHQAGNHLNFNPHVHAIATRDLVDTKSGEITEIQFIPYKTMRYDWQRTVCKFLFQKNHLTKEEYNFFLKSYPRGFHVYFEKINIEESASIFRIAQYIAFGLFHNSQIQKVDSNQQTLTFRYKSNVESITKEKTYESLTMPIDEFLARMLFFLPNKHEKSVRYYGIYVSPARKIKLESLEKKSNWAQAIKSSFDTKDPLACPVCKNEMETKVIYSFHASKKEKELKKIYNLIDGYFYQKRSRDPPETFQRNLSLRSLCHNPALATKKMPNPMVRYFYVSKKNVPFFAIFRKKI